MAAAEAGGAVHAFAQRCPGPGATLAAGFRRQNRVAERAVLGKLRERLALPVNDDRSDFGGFAEELLHSLQAGHGWRGLPGRVFAADVRARGDQLPDILVAKAPLGAHFDTVQSPAVEHAYRSSCGQPEVALGADVL